MRGLSDFIETCRQKVPYLAYLIVVVYLLISEGEPRKKSSASLISGDGTFDDCQAIVKEAFNERSFLKDDQYLLAVNSINWVRIIGQICYYFYASLKINKFEESLNFSVPTGNFGNVFACYSAHKMGMPLNKILVAVNNNNILQQAKRVPDGHGRSFGS